MSPLFVVPPPIAFLASSRVCHPPAARRQWGDGGSAEWTRMCEAKADKAWQQGKWLQLVHSLCDSARATSDDERSQDFPENDPLESQEDDTGELPSCVRFPPLSVKHDGSSSLLFPSHLLHKVMNEGIHPTVDYDSPSTTQATFSRPSESTDGSRCCHRKIASPTSDTCTTVSESAVTPGIPHSNRFPPTRISKNGY
ncbi:hypothetical protein MSAN_01855800 [Mycena sanguinolenta]|uniref:Uncharacterized protein n=1 Tax=Mycena sanguinolenta TaxID=230812 RepID=A0A8H7CSA1_9AGAR|nr:hypothetical protein MSAN_01855800 [Mycena sanguinolenta]